MKIYIWPALLPRAAINNLAHVFSGASFGKYWGRVCHLFTVHFTSSSLSFLSSTLFTCKFAIFSLLAVSISCFRHSQPKVDRKSQSLFPSFLYLNLRLVMNSAVKMQR